MGANGRVFVGFKVRRSTWFKWRTLAQANGCTVERATEALIEEALQRFGVETNNSPIETNNSPIDPTKPTTPMGDSRLSLRGLARPSEKSSV